MYRVYFDLDGKHVYLDLTASGTAMAQAETLMRYPTAILSSTKLMGTVAPAPPIPAITTPTIPDDGPKADVIRVDFKGRKRVVFE